MGRSVSRLVVLAVAVLLAGCGLTPFAEVGVGYMADNPSTAGFGDVIDADNPRAVIAAGVTAPLMESVEMTAAVRHESAPLATDYGSWGFYVAVRWSMFKR